MLLSPFLFCHDLNELVPSGEGLLEREREREDERESQRE